MKKISGRPIVCWLPCGKLPDSSRPDSGGNNREILQMVRQTAVMKKSAGKN